MSFIYKFLSKKKSKKKSKRRPLQIQTMIIDDKNNIYPTPFQSDNILEVESIYDDNNYISEKNLIKMLKKNNNSLTSKQIEKLKQYLEQQYALNLISDNELTLYKTIYPDFMADLEKKYKPKKKHSYISYSNSSALNKKILRRRHTSKYKKKHKSKKKKPKSL